jgi:hypothetical protein
MKKKWNDLTRLDRMELEGAGVINGCGGGRLLHWLVPDFRFRACCDQHDYNYWLGGSESERAKADWQFFVAMLDDAAKLPRPRSWWHVVLSVTYYLAVRVAGWWFFGYR